jgi:peptidoglycan/LPS O-acetylase OafA/YrhL
MEKHIDALTGIRGVAVLLVFFAHLQQHYFAYPKIAGTPIAMAPFFGITIFFVLSGFVIHWNYGILFATERPAVAGWRFFVARFSRLWPLHFALSVVALIWWPEPLRFVQHVFMVQTWVFTGTPNIAYFTTWSISSEWFFYFAYALGYPLLARLTKFGSLWLLVVAVCIAFGIVRLVGPYAHENDVWLLYYAPYLRVLEFFTGVVAAQIVMTRRAKNRDVPSDVFLLLALAFTMVLYRTSLGQMSVMNYFLAPLVAVTLIVISGERSIASRLLSARWLLWTGDRSYSIYMIEALYLFLCGKIELPLGYTATASRVFSPSDFAAGLGLAALGVGIVFVLADLSWKYFEMPARRAIKRALAGTSHTARPAPDGRAVTVDGPADAIK